MKILHKYFVCTCLLFFVSACSTLPENSTTNVEWENHSTRLSNIRSFQATGKLGYRGPNDTLSLNFYWKHTENKSELRLINLFGSTVLTLTMTPDGSKVVTSDEQIYEDKDANVLFSRLTGLEFPVSQLKYWIIGLPTQADTFQFNETNTLNSLQKRNRNRNWTLDYTRYQDYNGLPIPNQMTLHSTDTRIKIAISKWVINS
ncbi:lipoprotein insertase outer membrane protein LolB [Vibrio algarum]|uniref:Outer-membrane lipoprotein LolB n=1 Tax=Vibrio algarum TaxID=3020714 RepID=A0ABT4YQ67_9VIBR|nr:lipoprotein insertase outer membrane protein LolB [Vibrio sp. KJ40-1]MDB1123238.1 lipoprotein insertase outer membrane protein LolB [Vibrio sp. KJ40-1]